MIPSNSLELENSWLIEGHPSRPLKQKLYLMTLFHALNNPAFFRKSWHDFPFPLVVAQTPTTLMICSSTRDKATMDWTFSECCKGFLFWNPMEFWAPKLCFLEEDAESCETSIKHRWEEETWETVRGRNIISLILFLLKTFQANELENFCWELYMGPHERELSMLARYPHTYKEFKLINCSAWDLPWWGNFPQSTGYRSRNVRFKKSSQKKLKKVNVTY